MIQVNELRIGNFFKFKSTNSIEAVVDINTYGLKYPTINNVSIKDVEPIQITEDWLLRLGSKKINTNRITFTISRFKLIWREDYKYWYVVDLVSLTYLTKIEFVHEFQNFIKIMDGEELILIN